MKPKKLDINNINKEWTDHRNGHRYYITYYNDDKVVVRVAKYPQGDTIMESTWNIIDLISFANYVKDGF